MKAIILAGGQGIRLREIINDVPKPMALIANKPFLEYLILQLIKWNINDIVLSVGYKKEIIKSYFTNGDKWGVRILYSEESEPLGTGGAIREAAKLIDDEYFIVMNGDSFLDMDFNQLITFHKSKQSITTIGLVHVDNTSRYGLVETNENGEIIRFNEKGYDGFGLINGGVYIFNNEIINNISSRKSSLESEVLPILIRRGLHGMIVRSFFVDIGVPKDYLCLCKNPGRLFDVLN